MSQHRGSILGSVMGFSSIHRRDQPRSRDQPRPYQCSYQGCDNAFIQKRNLRRHEILKHGREKLKEGTLRPLMGAQSLERLPDDHSPFIKVETDQEEDPPDLLPDS